MDIIVLRILFVILLAAVCYFLRPFGIPIGWEGAALGAVAACAVIVFEIRVRALTLRRLIGAVAGSVPGAAPALCQLSRMACTALPCHAGLGGASSGSIRRRPRTGSRACPG